MTDDPEVVLKVDIPTDPNQIKEDMRVRRQAIRIMYADLAMLSSRLRDVVGFPAWAEYMEQVAEAGKEDIAAAHRLRNGEG